MDPDCGSPATVMLWTTVAADDLSDAKGGQ
jgi:hypothetical protein